jgi:hypothetical protein
MDVTSSMTKITENGALSWYDHIELMKGKRSPKKYVSPICMQQTQAGPLQMIEVWKTQ